MPRWDFAFAESHAKDSQPKGFYKPMMDFPIFPRKCIDPVRERDTSLGKPQTRLISTVLSAW